MVKIIADTTCGLPLDELNALEVDVIPQIIIFDGKAYKDDYEIDTPTFLSKLIQATELPKTAAPPQLFMNPFLKRIQSKGKVLS